MQLLEFDGKEFMSELCLWTSLIMIQVVDGCTVHPTGQEWSVSGISAPRCKPG